MNGQELPRALSTPTRRGVVRAVAWGVPAISLAAAAPAFATSTDALPGEQEFVTFASSLFWRPTSAEANAFGEGLYWGLSGIPEATILWTTQLTNTGPAMTQNVHLALGVPPGTGSKKDFQIIEAGDLSTTPGLNVLTPRPASGVGITLAPLPDNAPRTMVVAISAPNTITRSTSASWDLTVTPPGQGATKSVPVTSYTQFRNSLEP